MRVLNDKEKAARDKVNEMIASYNAELEALTKNNPDDNDPTMIEGETSTGYCVQMMVEPSEVVPILLKYNYATYAILGQEWPIEMWNEIGRKFGLDTVLSVDL